MDKQKTLTLGFIKPLMEPTYTLVWADYDDNLDSHHDLIQKCLDNKGRKHLWEGADVWYSNVEWETVRGIIAKLKGKCTVFNDFNKEDMDDFFSEHEDEIRDEIYSRNDSDVIKELIVHTDDIPVRVEILSNYDCIDSHWFEPQGDYRYEESYFGDMVDSLNLNPARVKRILTKHGYKAYGRLPSRKNRNDKEQVSYKRSCEEFVDSCYGANLLAYIGRVNLKELYGASFLSGEVVIPKDNCYGLFSSTYGGGSLLEMELKKDVRPKLEVKGYHDFRFQLGDKRSKYEYSIRHVYGVDDFSFGERISLVAS